MSGASGDLGDLERMANYFQGAGEYWQLFQEFREQVRSFGDKGSPTKSKDKF